MKLLFLPFILFLSLTSSAQSVNIDLKRQLDTILKSDQGIREFLDTEVKPARKDSLAKQLNYPRIELDQKPMADHAKNRLFEYHQGGTHHC